MTLDFIKRTQNIYEYLKEDAVGVSQRNLLFHAICQELLKDDYDKEKVNKDVPYGSIIGIGNSYLDLIFNKMKIFRLHAAYHDAFGYCKTKYNKGPGYSYIVHLPINSCFLGHVTGLPFWLLMSLVNRTLYCKLDI